MTNNLEKIKQISKINVSKVCKDLKINRANLLNGRTTKENEKKVLDELIKRYEEVKSQL